MLSNLLPQTCNRVRLRGNIQPEYMTDYCAFLLEHKLKLVLVCYRIPLCLILCLTFGKVSLCVRPITTLSCSGLFTKCSTLITVDHSLRHSLALLLSLVLHLHDDLLRGVLGCHLLLAGVLGAG